MSPGVLAARHRILARPVGLSAIPQGADCRLREYRRAVFLRFWEFHLRFRSHPGCVYYLMPWLRASLGWDEEQSLWFAFLNGNTQNPVTSWLLFCQSATPAHADRMLAWFGANYERLAFDTDRRHHKKALPEAVASYLDDLGGAPQARRIKDVARGGWPAMWAWARSLYTFGRLSAFSYLEYLRIMGIDFDCEDLMFEDLPGSRSHRNGACLVLGLDHLDWHHSNPSFDGHYPPEILAFLKAEAADMRAQMHVRGRHAEMRNDDPYRQPGQHPWWYDVSYFTLESTFCTYKSWHRPNRRYPGVYNDMLYDRIRAAEKSWASERDFSIFWQARRDCLPRPLRLEDNPHDPGCAPVKQNHYRETGHVIQMGLLWPEFRCDCWDGALARGAFGSRAA